MSEKDSIEASDIPDEGDIPDDFEEAFGMSSSDDEETEPEWESESDSGEFSEAISENTKDRLQIGIDGLDEMIRKGVPRESNICVIGGAGTGKTTFGMQFLAEGLENDEKGVYFSLEQEEDDIISTADSKGWNFSEHEANDDLVVVHMDPVEVATTLRSIRNELPRMISEFGASRVVLDSVTLIEMMFENRADGRNQIYRFMRELSNAGATTLVTSEASEDNAYASRYGTIEYLSDAVFVLQYVRTDSASETRLALEITKIRDTSHSRQVRPYEHTDD
ncbi:MAG: KaiC domain-containing protein, partial [Halobacteria archaeon]|nr:KaiC domain-containing protein [Halobacteria archaeon]